MQAPTGELDELTAKLNRETARIPWKELQKFFAQGKALAVAGGVDLIQVARWMAEDDADQIQQLMTANQFGPVDEATARQWLQQDALVWAVVAAPFVLVQAVDDND